MRDAWPGVPLVPPRPRSLHHPAPSPGCRPGSCRVCSGRAPPLRQTNPAGPWPGRLEHPPPRGCGGSGPPHGHVSVPARDEGVCAAPSRGAHATSEECGPDTDMLL